MAGSAFIITRSTRDGKRYIVRFRLGGRGFPVVHGGSFKRERDARARRDFIAGELAAGRNPRESLRAVADVAPARPLREWGTLYLASRHDLGDEAKKNQRSHLRAINEKLGDRDPLTITPADVSLVVAAWAGTLKPSSIKRYVTTMRQVLDFAGIKPNPAKDDQVRLPRVVSEEPDPPTADQFLAILDKSPQRWRLLLVTLEQTAMRIGEASNLTWGDVDVAESRFRLRASETKTRKARWVQVPAWLMSMIEDTCPQEDRVPGRPVFMGLTADVCKNVMARACNTAGIPLYSPHDLRHRRLSLWHGQGVPAKELAERAGHSRASMTLDVYSHVMPLDEAPRESLTALLVVHR